MNTRMIFPAVAGLALALATPALHAASANGTVTIPFAFEANSTAYPAGTYTIDHSNNQAFSQVIMLRDQKQHATMLVARNDDEESVATRSTLVFERHGNTYALTELKTAGNATRLKFPLSSRLVRADRERNGNAASTNVEVPVTDATPAAQAR